MTHPCEFLVQYFRFYTRILKLRIFLLGCLLQLSFSLSAQLSQHKRYERIQSHNAKPFTIISLKDQGLALVRDKEEYHEGKKLWEILLLDSVLTEKWTIELPIENRYQLIGYEYARDAVFILFRAGETESDFLHLVSVNLINHEISKFDIKHQFNLRLTHFSVTGNHAIFGGYVIREPAIVLFEMTAKQVKVVPGFFLSDTELLDVRVNVNNTFNAVLIERGKKEKKKLIVKTFDESGILILEDEIDIDQGKTIIAAQTSILKRDEMMVLGTYGDNNLKQATGIFSVAIDPFNKQVVRYFDIAVFDHFLDYLPAKRSNKIKIKSQHAREVGKSPDFKLHLHPIRIEESSSGYILISEVYQPSSSQIQYPYWNNNYNQNGYYSYGFNSPTNRYYNAPYTTNTTQSGDYKIEETVITLFDAEGKFVWDHSLNIPDIHIPALEQVGDFIFLENRAVIAYKKENVIQSTFRFIHDHETLSDTLKLTMKNTTDVLRNEEGEDGGIRHWYNLAFYAWGYQSVRDKTKEDGQNRYVFYITKIKVD